MRLIGSTKRPLRIAACVSFAILGLATAAWLERGAPQLRSLPDWFYTSADKGSLDMLLVAVCAALLPVLVRRSFGWAQRSFALAAGHVLLASLILQLATGLMARTGAGGWIDRFNMGHGEFTLRAKGVSDPIWVLRNYEPLVAGEQLGLYPKTKPPGTLGVYLLIDHTARWPIVEHALWPLSAIVGRLPAVLPEDRTLVTWTVLSLALCSALTALVLCFVSRSLFGGRVQDARSLLYPAWLWVSAPAVNVITVHLDSTVFPLLSALCLWLCVHAARTQRSWPAALGGGLCMLAVYCSYGLMPLLLLCAALLPGGRGGMLRLGALCAGALGMLLLLRWGLNWQPLLGYWRSMSVHLNWRPNLSPEWRRGLALVELALFLGPPLVLAFLVSIVRSGAALAWRPLRDAAMPLTLATCAVLLLLSYMFGVPEAARLWLFTLPWIACACGALFTRASARSAFGWLLGAQLLLVPVVKNYLLW